jgi:hypothetical protein
MAEVLAEHTADWISWDDYSERGEYYTCLCKEVSWHVNTSADYYQAHAAHQQGMLTAAGFGLVKAASAGALRDAADAWQVRMDTIGRGSVEAKTFMLVRAASIEAGE